MQAPGLPQPSSAERHSPGLRDDRADFREAGAFILRLHWGIVVLTPVLTFLSGRETPTAVWFILGFFVLFTAALQALLSLRPSSLAGHGVGYGLLIADLLLVTGLIWARGGLVTDAYHFYYLVIAGASILFGVRESIGFALAAGVLYGLVIYAGGGGEAAPLERVAIRTVYFVLIGWATAYLAAQERRQRLARTEAQRLLQDLHEAHTQLKVHAREMSQRAVTDGLTGLFNHTYFHQRLEEELTRAERYNRPLSLLMLDLDDFKAYNDANGHLSGDAVLARVAGLIRDSVRRVDICCRYGGEEFAVIMPETDSAAAATAAERIRVSVQDALPERGCPTVSAGVATFPHQAATRLELIEASDRALYYSKRHGKNLVSTVDATTQASHRG